MITVIIIKLLRNCVIKKDVLNVCFVENATNDPNDHNVPLSNCSDKRAACQEQVKSCHASWSTDKLHQLFLLSFFRRMMVLAPSIIHAKSPKKCPTIGTRRLPVAAYVTPSQIPSTDVPATPDRP